MSKKTHSTTVQNNNFGVIGNPIAHSKSPIIHNFWYEKLQIKANYQKILVENESKLASVLSKNKGINITLPYKELVLKYVDFLSDEVKTIKAANTIVNDNGVLKAFNTDVFGFFEPIRKNNFQNALLIGAGGAARACYYALNKNGIQTTVYNRSKKDDFLCKVLNELDEYRYDLIINSTSASLKNELPIDKNILEKLAKNANFAYDLAYSHDIFLDFCKEKNPNIKTLDGLNMLVYQAALAFEYFCGIFPSEELISGAKELIK